MMSTMNTSQTSTLYGPQDLRLEQRQISLPGPSELQVIIRATGLCGSDLHYYQHNRNGDFLVREPLILGHESAGVVSVIGSDVQGFQPGDRVALEVGLPCSDCHRCAEGRYNLCQGLRFRSSAKSFPHFQGTLQERINHPAAWCHKLPNNVSFELGAILEPLSVAIHAQRRAQIKEESCTLVFGAGAIGLLCAAMAKVAGSSNVIIADIQAERVEFAIENGFAHRGFVVPRKHGQDIAEKLRLAQEIASLVATAKNPRSVGEIDAVFECTGVEACTQAAIYATRPGGKVVIVGMGNPVQTIPISAATSREVDILGTFRYANTYTDAIEMVSNESLLPDLSKLVTHRFHGLMNIPRAFEMAARAQDDSGNLVLKVVIDTNDMRTSSSL